MRTLWNLILTLACVLPSLAATTWPASTNADQTLFGTNTFTKPIIANGGLTSTGNLTGSVVTATSSFNGPGTGLTGTAAGLTAWPAMSGTNTWIGTNIWSKGYRTQWFDDQSSGYSNSFYRVGQVISSGAVIYYATNAPTITLNKLTGDISIKGALRATNGMWTTGLYTPYTNVPTSTSGGPATNVLIDPANGDYQTVAVTATNLYFTLASPSAAQGANIRLDFWISNTCSVGFSPAGVYAATIPSYTYAYNSNINSLMFDHPLPLKGTNYWKIYQLSN